MACIVLVGGAIGCGKTTFINYFHKNESVLLQTKPTECDHSLKSDLDVKNRYPCYKLLTIHFDNLCTIEEQEILMTTLRGWRNFREDLLMAAERLIAEILESENSLAGPLTERSFKLKEKISLMIDGGCNNLSNSFIVIEDNYYYRSMRYDWFQIARRNSLGFATIFLHCPLKVAVSRNANRGYHIPEEKIEKMFKFIELPDPAKFKWEKYSIVFDSSQELTNSAMIDVVNVIKEASRHPAEMVLFEQKIEAQKVCSKNVIHQTDKILRRIVSKKISRAKCVNTTEDDLKTLVLNLVDIRQKILVDVKHGDIHLPQELVDKIQNLGIDCVLDAYVEFLENLFNLTLEDLSTTELSEIS